MFEFEHFAQHQEKTVRITSTPLAGAKTCKVTPSFYCSFWMCYIWLAFVSSLKKIWMVHHFQVTVYTLRVFTTRFKVHSQFGSEKKLITQPNIEKYYSFQVTKNIRTFLKKKKKPTSWVRTHYVILRGDRSLLVCTREFLLKSLSPKQNFVAGRSRKQSNQTEFVWLVGATKFCWSDKDFYKHSPAHTEGLI